MPEARYVWVSITQHGSHKQNYELSKVFLEKIMDLRDPFRRDAKNRACFAIPKLIFPKLQRSKCGGRESNQILHLPKYRTNERLYSHRAECDVSRCGCTTKCTLLFRSFQISNFHPDIRVILNLVKHDSLSTFSQRFPTFSQKNKCKIRPLFCEIILSEDKERLSGASRRTSTVNSSSGSHRYLGT